MGELDNFISKLKEAKIELNKARVSIAGLGHLNGKIIDLIIQAEENNKNIKPNSISK